MQSVTLQRVLLSPHTDLVLPDPCRALPFPPLSLKRVCASGNPSFIRPPAGGVEQTNSQHTIQDFKRDKKVTQSRTEKQESPQPISFSKEPPPGESQLISRDSLHLWKSGTCSAPFFRNGKNEFKGARGAAALSPELGWQTALKSQQTSLQHPAFPIQATQCVQITKGI